MKVAHVNSLSVAGQQIDKLLSSVWNSERKIERPRKRSSRTEISDPHSLC